MRKRVKVDDSDGSVKNSRHSLIKEMAGLELGMKVNSVQDSLKTDSQVEVPCFPENKT